ncbi:MAG: cyclic beta 1-2 glucan synthetase [Candidatus Syntrophosphaera sp.]|nr:cyclic beta 1-2 glucan synthetase [Candidatus Syntrophosphaera sp.]
MLTLRIRNLRHNLSRLWAKLGRRQSQLKQAPVELPLRSELLSADQMKLHGQTIAREHQLATGRPRGSLLARLAENESLLLDVHGLLTEDVKDEQRITPAGEWLLDNFYLIEGQIRIAKRHFSKGYNWELPYLLNGPLAGLPRVYDIALETISHGDGRVDPENLSSFVAAYQSVTPLKLGELWAIPIMLRLALMENLRRVAASMAMDRIDRQLAEYWAGQMMETAAKNPSDLILTIADMARSELDLSSAFVAAMSYRLQGHVPNLALPLHWIEQRLSESGLTIEQLVRAENQQQAANQVSVSNSIGSLRLLGSLDWQKFVESMSRVEQILIEDPAGIYGSMDFTSRDSYRHVVERIAKKSRHTESEVARFAVRLARKASYSKDSDRRRAHVGYYLIDKGLYRLEHMARIRFSPGAILRKANQHFSLLLYAGSITLLTLLLSGLLAAAAFSGGLRGWALVAAGSLALLSTSHLALAMVNWLATLLSSPKLLPRMDYSKGIPPEARSLVVIPTMITSLENVESLATALEVRYLANREGQLLFGLLTDFADAGYETLPQDEAVLEFARERIEELNAKYQDQQGSVFFLFHRPRNWNPRDKIWMGYERKRGKLADLNAFLRGGARDSFSLVVGDTALLAGVKYVITLDTDTQLPRDSARQFIGVMAHPLNRPLFDQQRRRVVEGYGILQPRVAISMPGANRSRYAALRTSEPGIDPYTRTVSDVYQDLFGEGSFIGKGIYDVDAFELATGGRFPENRILSHDLLEGCYARSGLLTDVQLYEEYPSRYFADVSRRHRWIRGDWQIGQWALPLIPGHDGRLQKNPLSLLSRWKIFDNLRRSLSAAALTLMLLMGWTMMASPLGWTLAVVAIMLLPALLPAAINALRKPADVTLKEHLAAELAATRRRFSEAVFNFACLPHEAWYSLDALLRTGWRMLFSRRNLLEWNPSGGADDKDRDRLADSFRKLWISPALAASALAGLALYRAEALPPALPILALWLIAPAIVWWYSRPFVRREARLTEDQTVWLGKLARKTWASFETFVGPGDNWLPPDNVQDNPAAAIAHRTSPTNMGLALLANLSAYDFGFISAGKLLDRTALALRTMEGLQRYRGHFYNWYDTQTLLPLEPLYISSVDSGNLTGNLIILRQGLLLLEDDRILGPRLYEGLRDTLEVLTESVAAAPKLNAVTLLSSLRQQIESVTISPPATVAAARQGLEELRRSAEEVVARMEAADADPESQANWWARAFAERCREALAELDLLAPEPLAEAGDAGSAEIPTLKGLQALETAAGQQARARLAAIRELGLLCETLSDLEYDFLYDADRHLLSIGYNVRESRRDSGYYDLLASEARFASFVAIAQDKLPQASWFSLGRLLTTAGGEPILLSWSGSMFEYLMPLLVMPTYEHTLLDQTYKAVVARQIDYGKRRSVPWGISESGYNATDAQLNYQYRAFGVPGLGLKRGLAEDLVIAPYASALALMVDPEEACANLERLSAHGFETRYGFYEAIDYTPSRVPRGQAHALIRSYMAHHQGMVLLSLAYLLLDRPMQKRFEANTLFQATLLLLQERIPRAKSYYMRTTRLAENYLAASPTETPIRVFTDPDTPNPELQLLSNGRYNVMVTNAGGGYSRWKDLDVTRWREDRTCDNWGTFCFIRDVESGQYWSTAYQPTLKRPKNYEAIFLEGRVEFRCRNNGLDTHTEIAVSPEDDIELRRVRITNRGRARKTIDVASYAEVVLATPASDALHPAFSNLFVQTEIIRHSRGILCTRRPRSESEKEPWMFHLMAAYNVEIEEVSYETDRGNFIGRGNTIAEPAAMEAGGAGEGNALLSNSEGSVLDPIVAICYRITLEPDQVAVMDMVTGVAENRDEALALMGKYQDRRLANRVFNLAWTHGHVLLRQFNITEADAQLYCRLASSIIYANASLRAEASILIMNRHGQSGLWGYAISGDLPIVLLRIEDPANIDLVRQMIQAHVYWRLHGLAVDLVIWNEDHGGYRQLLHDEIMGQIASGIDANLTDQPGGIFVRPAEQVSEEDRILIQTVARVIISDTKGSLSDQINGRIQPELTVPALALTRAPRPAPPPVPPAPRHDLMFFNGLGGFTPDGREYVITTSQAQLTPAPWANVIANPLFGTVVSESGLAYTWCENSHEFRLTPWGNDPLGDSRGEAFYIRDEERGHYWSPTPLPRRGITPYVTRHGFGYSVFEHTERGIKTELWIFVASDANVKFAVLKIRNGSDRSRKLSATGYVEWVLGDLRAKTSMQVITGIDPKSGAIFARNSYNTSFPNRTAFFDTDEISRSLTCDRTEFLGRNGRLDAPAAMTRARLSGRVGAALDPCAAIQVNFELGAGQEREIVFRLGLGQNPAEAGSLARRFQGPIAAREALDAVWEHWNHTLGAISVETPDQSLNVLANGWLLYQTLSCRLWARTGAYQSGGAFGFRDQLQDVMALIHARPLLARGQLLLCATRQFPEGDVQHWWHPPTGQGVRTHCSDDRLWLPLVTCHYVFATGDTGVLDEPLGFLEGRPVNSDEDSYFDLPGRSEQVANLYQHCVLALMASFRYGRHGLPLIGSGDWNDGMNLVGEQGQGESVWLGFFLHFILIQFAELARLRGDEAFASRCLSEAGELSKHIEESGWDGQWYRRAYFDDGTPLGSASNPECQIDSIAQSWSVLSGVGDQARSVMAMQALEKRLVRRDFGLIQLLDPPFDASGLNPGYIKGYVPGIRENGGQYTHAAIWAIMAFAKLGDRQKAWELFTLINPVNHARNAAETEVYKVEPYAAAADVYAVAPHIGRGGWTWYTGSAAWMYRLIVESLLGVSLEIDKLRVSPCLPEGWDGFKLHYRYRETMYHITVTQEHSDRGVRRMTLDGMELSGETIPLADDHLEHWVDIFLPD